MELFGTLPNFILFIFFFIEFKGKIANDAIKFIIVVSYVQYNIFNFLFEQ